MNYYISATYNGQTNYWSYIGMSQSEITAVLTNMGATNLQFIDEGTYQASLLAKVNG